jgi:hypothetical protein
MAATILACSWDSVEVNQSSKDKGSDSREDPRRCSGQTPGPRLTPLVSGSVRAPKYQVVPSTGLAIVKMLGIVAESGDGMKRIYNGSLYN